MPFRMAETGVTSAAETRITESDETSFALINETLSLSDLPGLLGGWVVGCEERLFFLF